MRGIGLEGLDELLDLFEAFAMQAADSVVLLFEVAQAVEQWIGEPHITGV